MAKNFIITLENCYDDLPSGCMIGPEELSSEGFILKGTVFDLTVMFS